VRVTLRRSAGWPVFVGLSAAAAAANACAWLLSWAAFEPARPIVALPAVMLGVAMAMWAWRTTFDGDLAWDGAQWWWRDAPGQVHAAIDLGGWMLLRFADTAHATQWIVARRGSTEGAWSALRAALYARRPTDPLDAPPVV
jgi:putative Ca2+/H+ antiporter (TMEM165/GDT1 family)